VIRKITPNWLQSEYSDFIDLFCFSIVIVNMFLERFTKLKSEAFLISILLSASMLISFTANEGDQTISFRITYFIETLTKCEIYLDYMRGSQIALLIYFLLFILLIISQVKMFRKR
jgi:hypothetical protein